jgi:hypothetical protein
MYADDLVIYYSGTDFNDIFEKLKVQSERIVQWCNENKLNINFNKTKFQLFYKSHDKPSPELLSKTMQISGHDIEQVQEFRYLGVLIDSSLSFKAHFNHVTKKVSQSTSYLNGIRRCLTPKVLSVMVNSHIMSHVLYCINAWAVQTDNSLIAIQDKIDRLLLRFFYPSICKRFKSFNYSAIVRMVDVTELRETCRILSVKNLRDISLLKFAFRFFHSNKDDVTSSNRRTWPLLPLTKHRTSLFQQSISYRAFRLWNSLPRNWTPDISYTNFIDDCRNYLVNKDK